MRKTAGFSLAELLVATAITLGVGAVIFQLFFRNERVFRDQAVILEMQQTARMALSQIADDIRVAGQSIPSSLNDILLPGTGPSRLNIRMGFTATETPVNSPLPFSVSIGDSATLSVESISGFSASRQAFLWNEEGWSRSKIDSVSAVSKTIRLTASAASESPLQFTAPPAISLDEAVAIYWDSSSKTIKRTTATTTENPANPSWAPANELATNITALTFSYYDISGDPLTSDIVAQQSLVAAIEARVTVRASSVLSDGSRPTFSQSIRAVPRNFYFRPQ
jgi:Tfp pilus assembly protein PilW